MSLSQSLYALTVSAMLMGLSGCGLLLNDTGKNGGGEQTWLEELIEQLENRPVADSPRYVEEYIYSSETVYYLPPPGCCDFMSTLYDASGRVALAACLPVLKRCRPAFGASGVGGSLGYWIGAG
ncbi:MAG: hypothetical protein KJ749_13570 [Planctomycetes bacterium]|nr:hypothetical protein [Planctomycetota bacterium]